MKTDIEICEEIASSIGSTKPDWVNIDTYELEDEGAIMVVHPVPTSQFEDMDMMTSIVLAVHGIPMSE